MHVRRFLAALTAGLLVGVLTPVVLATPAAAAVNCDLGGFEIDGNIPQNCAPVRDDWANQPGTALGAGGLYDSATSKDTLTTSTWTTAVGAVPNNLTINNATSFQRTGADGHVYLYVRWDRTATNGTGKYAIEVTNAPAVVVAGAPRPDRSLGGVVAYLQFQGGGAPTLGQFCTYTSQANYPTSVNPTAAGCTTTPAITSFANGASGAFIEVGFDLTALGISAPGCTATADTSALYVRSIFGNEATGNLSGFRAPVTVTAPSTCGTLEITKESLNDLATDDTTEFDYEVGLDGSDPVVEDSITIGGSDSFQVAPGTEYEITELIPDGAPWSLWSVECTLGDDSVILVDDGEPTGETLEVATGETTSCVITNATSLVTIAKATIPDGSDAEFSFDVGTTEDAFALSDGESHTMQFAPGTVVSVVEQLPVGWDLDTVDCGQAASTPIPGGVEVTTSAGSGVTCTFGNEQRGTVNITKASLNDLATDDPTDFEWEFGDGGTDPIAEGDLEVGDTDQVVNVLPGDGYTLEETIPDGAPWVLWSIVCQIGTQPGVTIVDDGEYTGETIPVQPGQTTNCVITNATSIVTVEKQTNPDGSNVTFDFDATGQGSFSLADSDTETLQYLPGAEATITEDAEPGWDLDSIDCEPDGDPAAGGVQVTTSEGSTTACVFTNEQHGTIIIEKVVVGLEDSTFDYTGDLGPFSIETTGGLGDESFTVSAGSYSVTETAEPGYDTTNLVCDTEDGVEIDTVTWTVTVELDPAEVVTCTFTNTERGLIVVQKETVPANYDQDFNFTFNGNQDFTLNDFDNPEWQSELLEPGTYTVTENTLPDGWTLGGISCGEVDGSTATIELEPGQTITCVVTNVAEPGTATLTKSVTGVTDDYQWAFDVILTQEPDGAPVVQQVTNGDLPDSAVATWSNLVVGATYTLEEGTLPFGWTSEGIECGEVDDESEAAGFQFTVTPGFELDCTLTNAADPAEVELTKTVSNINPDAEWSFDFTLDGDEQALTDTDPVGNWADLIPGAEYTIIEDDVPGWTEGAITCLPNTGNAALADADAEAAGYQFTATPGLVLTCTADNAADPADLTVTKTTVGGNGTFEFTVTQQVEAGDEFVDSVATVGGTGEVVFADLVPGYEYSVAETHVPEGWTAGVLECVITDVGGDEVEVDPTGFWVEPGNLIECAITNTKQAMAVTGSTVPLLAAWAALVLLVGGAGALVLVSRQRRRGA